MELLEKQKVIAYLNEMPEHFSAEEMIEHIFLLSKIERGLRDVQEGRIIPHDEVVAKFKKWQQR